MRGALTCLFGRFKFYLHHPLRSFTHYPVNCYVNAKLTFYAKRG